MTFDLFHEYVATIDSHQSLHCLANTGICLSSHFFLDATPTRHFLPAWLLRLPGSDNSCSVIITCFEVVKDTLDSLNSYLG